MRGTGGLDENAVSMLYATHRLALVRLAALLVDDQASAEDVVRMRSSAYTGIGRSSGTGGRGGISANRGRQRGAVCPSAAGHAAALSAAPDSSGVSRGGRLAALLADEHHTVLRAVRSLPQRQQEILALRYWSNLTEAEIAQTLGISRGAVTSPRPVARSTSWKRS
jgi:DNA-directed RNA polymerase specialized sigma24 family protein